MSETRSSSIEIINLGASCDQRYTVSMQTIPLEQVAPVFGFFIERSLIRLEIESERYGNRVLECVVDATQHTKTFMDMETWAEVIVLF